MEQDLTLLQFCALLGLTQANGSKNQAYRFASDKYRARCHRHLTIEEAEGLRHMIEECSDRSIARSHLFSRAS